MKSEAKVRKRTVSPSFGVSKREGHDSSIFYKRKLYGEEKKALGVDLENSIPQQYLDKVLLKSSENMLELPDNSIQLMVTSPPYNVGKDYDEDLSLDEYRSLLKKVFKETFRVLVNGGRACVNIANVGRKPYIPLHAYVVHDLLEIGFLMRGEIIWNKNSSAGVSTAWGSWKSATNPTLRDTHEYILVFNKGDFSRPIGNKLNTITRDEFLTFTKSVWEFPAESARRVGHPAPFPIELPYRFIQLYTFKDDIVLDPFCGVGTTCIASIKSGRHFVGYETNSKYVDIAKTRIENETAQTDLTQFSSVQ